MVKVEGFNVTTRRLNRLSNFDKEVSEKLPELGGSAVSILITKPYSAATGGRYVRTHDLQGSYDWTPTGRLQVTVSNDANERGRYYSGYVVDRQLQARIHKGRWWLADEVVKPAVTKFNNDMGQEAVRIMGAG